MAAEDKNNNIQSVERVALILNCFLETEELGITEIAQKAKLNKSTAFGLINTMESIGFLTQNPQTKRYRLGIKLFTLGNLVQRRLDIRNEARTYCESLSEKYNATVHLAEVYGKSLIYIDKVNKPDSVIVYSYLGKSAPLYCTGVGKAILAYLPEEEINEYVDSADFKSYTPYTIMSKEELYKVLSEVRSKGYAIDNQEIEEGLRCIAAPIFNYNHKPIAAISIANSISKITTDQIPYMAEEVMEAANKISKRMGYYIHK